LAGLQIIEQGALFLRRQGAASFDRGALAYTGDDARFDLCEQGCFILFEIFYQHA
jgi:hypothetical protein